MPAMEVPSEIIAAMPRHETCQAFLENVLPRLMGPSKAGPWTEWAVSVRWLDGPYYKREEYNRKNKNNTYKGRDLTYGENPSEWLERARKAYPGATYFVQHQSELPSPVAVAPSRLQQHLSCLRGMFALDGPTDPRREDSKRIPDVSHASPRKTSETIPMAIPDGMQRFVMVIHPFNSISSEYLSVRYGEVLKVLSRQRDHLEVEQFVEPKIMKHGLVYGRRCVMLQGEPGKVDIVTQSADGEWMNSSFQALALVDFKGDGPGETSLQMGDKVRIFDVKLHWAFVTSLDGQTYGWVPHRLLKEMDVPGTSS